MTLTNEPAYSTLMIIAVVLLAFIVSLLSSSMGIVLDNALVPLEAMVLIRKEERGRILSGYVTAKDIIKITMSKQT
jgi:hypothetical protein